MRPALIALLLGACSSSGTLVVQVRTDLAPEAEFTAATTTLTSLADGTTWVASLDAADGADWSAGVRVAELGDLPAGDYRAEVDLVMGGAPIVGRPLRVSIDEGVHVATVLLTRDCAGVSCPGAGDPSAVACLGGRCVPEGCSEERPDLCPMPECDDATPCPAPGGDCASAECSASGACFLRLRHGDCADGICDPEAGCATASGTTCFDGVAGARDSLIALYLFDENVGSTVYDVSGAAPIVDLELDPAAGLTWIPDGVRLQGPLLASVRASEQLAAAMVASGELSVELWLRTDALGQVGPARIVTLSRDATDAGFMIGQDDTRLAGRMHSSATNANGTAWASGSCPMTAYHSNTLVFEDTTTLHHVALTFGVEPRDGVTKSFLLDNLSGTPVVHTTDACDGIVDANLSTWPSTGYRLSLGDEVVDSRPWSGRIYQMAIYARRLTEGELVMHGTACETSF